MAHVIDKNHESFHHVDIGSILFFQRFMFHDKFVQYKFVVFWLHHVNQRIKRDSINKAHFIFHLF